MLRQELVQPLLRCPVLAEDDDSPVVPDSARLQVLAEPIKELLSLAVRHTLRSLCPVAQLSKQLPLLGRRGAESARGRSQRVVRRGVELIVIPELLLTLVE